MFASKHLQGARLLVGDRDAARCIELQRTLGAYGADVAAASSNVELLTWLVERGPFDAVISACGLSGPRLIDVIAMTRSAGLDVGFIVLAPPSEASRLRDRGHDMVVIDEPCGDLVLAREIDRLLETPRRFDGARCVFASCVRCGRPHIMLLTPAEASRCVRCLADEPFEIPEFELGGEG